MYAPGAGPCRRHGPDGQALLHAALVGLDHLLDHLAANGTGFPGGQMTVVTLLQVDADFLGGLHLELLHGSLGFGDIDRVVIVVAHTSYLLTSFCETRFMYRRTILSRNLSDMTVKNRNQTGIFFG